MSGAAEAILRRHRGVTIAGLALVAALAWAWIVSGAGMRMEMAWTLERIALTLAMWWVMMVAMMVPAAAPTILLYGKAAPQPHSGAFLAGYLLCWLGFSFLALALHIALEQAGHMMPMAMALSSRWLAGGLLIVVPWLWRTMATFGSSNERCSARPRNAVRFERAAAIVPASAEAPTMPAIMIFVFISIS